MKHALILATMISTSVLAQTANHSPALPPPPAAAPTAELAPDTSTNLPPAPKKSSHRKKTAPKKSAAAKKSATETNAAPPVTFAAGDTGVAKQNNINVRAQARINSEVIGHLQKGETVTVLEEVVLKHAKTDEPSRWLRIALPATNHAWVDTQYLNPTNHTVWAHKLNIRGGPGENYSVIGELRRDDVVTPIGTKDAWTEISAPTNAFAFVAAHLLNRRETPPAPPLAALPPVVTPVESAPPLAAANGSTPPGLVMPPPTEVPPVAVPPVPIPTPQPVVEEPPPKRIVEREGVVGGTVSIQSPSHYELHNLDNGKVMDYLYSTTTNVVLGRYRGYTVLVAGEEELDERWPNTPVLTIQKIQIVK